MEQQIFRGMHFMISGFDSSEDGGAGPKSGGGSSSDLTEPSKEKLTSLLKSYGGKLHSSEKTIPALDSSSSSSSSASSSSSFSASSPKGKKRRSSSGGGGGGGGSSAGSGGLAPRYYLVSNIDAMKRLKYIHAAAESQPIVHWLWVLESIREATKQANAAASSSLSSSSKGSSSSSSSSAGGDASNSLLHPLEIEQYLLPLGIAHESCIDHARISRDSTDLADNAFVFPAVVRRLAEKNSGKTKRKLVSGRTNDART